MVHISYSLWKPLSLARYELTSNEDRLCVQPINTLSRARYDAYLLWKHLSNLCAICIPVISHVQQIWIHDWLWNMILIRVNISDM